MPNTRHKSTQIQKVDYLRLHPKLKLMNDRLLVEALRNAGLVAKSTYWKDVHPRQLKEDAYGSQS